MTETEYLEAEKTSILSQLSSLAGLGLGASAGVSENGRSIDVNGGRKSLQERLDWINLRLAQLSGPFAISSTGVP